MARRGFARADRTRPQVSGKHEKISKTAKAAGIPASDRTERQQIIERLKEKK
jgi:hypothetical protein